MGAADLDDIHPLVGLRRNRVVQRSRYKLLLHPWGKGTVQNLEWQRQRQRLALDIDDGQAA
jgi:hypothetical protein